MGLEIRLSLRMVSSGCDCHSSGIAEGAEETRGSGHTRLGSGRLCGNERDERRDSDEEAGGLFEL